jgi:hypothetical protein
MNLEVRVSGGGRRTEKWRIAGRTGIETNILKKSFKKKMFVCVEWLYCRGRGSLCFLQACFGLRK